MTLSDVMPGMSFRVLKVRTGGEIGRRLADMGFTEGASGELVRGALMRGPIQVRLGGYDLLIRRGEAACVEIESAGSSTEAGEEPRSTSSGPGSGRGSGRRGSGSGSWGNIFKGLFGDSDCCGGARGRHGRTGNDR